MESFLIHETFEQAIIESDRDQLVYHLLRCLGFIEFYKKIDNDVIEYFAGHSAEARVERGLLQIKNKVTLGGSYKNILSQVYLILKYYNENADELAMLPREMRNKRIEGFLSKNDIPMKLFNLVSRNKS